MKTTYYLRKSLFCFITVGIICINQQGGLSIVLATIYSRPMGNRIQWTTVPVLFT